MDTTIREAEEGKEGRRDGKDGEAKQTILMIQGEFTFVYRMVRKLERSNIICVAACTERMAEQKVLPDETVEKRSIFQFRQFRRYF